MAVQFSARFEKKDSSILLTRTFNGEETEDVTEDIAHLKDIYVVKDWRDPAISIKVGRALFSLLNGEHNIFELRCVFDPKLRFRSKVCAQIIVCQYLAIGQSL
ncbi:MAG: hypothetical protein WBA22_04155 [Candidatus Methanofastidiosia archaeon]